MNEKGDCIHYSEVRDMNAIVPCCDFYEFGNTPCKDCKRYYSKKDLVAVVRCKDCRYYLEGKIYPDAGRWCHKLADGLDMPPDGYCSYGERKEDDKL